MEAQTTPNIAAPVGATAIPKWIWIAGAAVAVTAAGLAAALTRGLQAPSAAAPAVVAAPAAMSPAAPVAPAVVEAPPARIAQAEPARPAPPVLRAAEPREPAPAPVCASCGTVESVQAVRVKGEGSGVGAVTGGVLGGVVGHQLGGGRGRDALTVLGAVGGGFAGHEAEKQVRAKTVYSVKVRMDDGTLRTLQQAQAPAVGEKVRVEGTRLRPA
jgi:outer membrane lipoprotein SlyB